MSANDTVLHAEIYTDTRDGEKVRVSCTCAIGYDHDYQAWVDMVGGDRYKGLEGDAS